MLAREERGDQPLFYSVKGITRSDLVTVDELVSMTTLYIVRCSYWWMSTHQRIIGWFDDEKPQVVKKFNEGMRRYFDSGRCGNFNYIDVFYMTDSLVRNFTLDATSEANKAKSLSVSYDYVHYGMEINLLKAQTFINALSNYYKRASLQSV